jgi:hypothetical protein
MGGNTIGKMMEVLENKLNPIAVRLDSNRYLRRFWRHKSRQKRPPGP